MRPQSEICTHLKKNKYKNPLDEQTAKKLLGRNNTEFLIGDECLTSISTSRFFKIFYEETRTDQLFIQRAPMICFRSGYLSIDEKGNISLLDNQFKSYRSSKIFYFEGGTLKTRDDYDIEAQERMSSRCVKTLVTLGLFAFAGLVFYKSITKSNDVNFTP